MERLALVTVMVYGLGLYGCASMSEQECLVTDWRSVGFEDGVAGRTEGSIAGYRQACSQHGVTPNLDQYRSGHAEGVEVYCRAGNAFEVGHRGARYQGVCPAGTEQEFLAAYSEGRQLYELEGAVRTIDNQISARYRHLETIKKDLTAAAAAIVADETSAERRAELLLETASMAKEQGQIEEEIEALEVERALRVDDLVAYQETLAYGL
jgi:hypothetical protein